MSRRYLKPILGGLVIILTIGIFIYYVSGHPDIIRQLRRLPINLIGLLLALYIIFMACLAWIQRATLQLCEIKLDPKESFLLVSYSSIINFFGPLQSGPAFRAAYLKRKHNANLKRYAVATLLYYGFFAIFSLVFIATYLIGLWALLAIIVAVLCIPIGLRLLVSYPKLLPKRFHDLKIRSIGQLAAATLAQVSVVALIFYTELNSLGQHVAAVPALIYTGAANFALFVSVTPGAIGFREAFVSFTRGLHHLNGSQIVSASLIDRGIYILMLALLAVVVFGLHAGDALNKKEAAKK